MSRTDVPDAVLRTIAYQDQVRPEAEKEAKRALEKQAHVDGGSIKVPEGFKPMRIEVYACPTLYCPNYYGATNMPDLGSRFTSVMTEERHREPGDPCRGPEPDGIPPGERHTRAECPDCRALGVYVERVRVAGFVLVPTK